MKRSWRCTSLNGGRVCDNDEFSTTSTDANVKHSGGIPETKSVISIERFGRWSLQRIVLFVACVWSCCAFSTVQSFAVTNMFMTPSSTSKDSPPSSQKLPRQNRKKSSGLYHSSTALQESVGALEWTDFYHPDTAKSSETPVLLLHGLLGSKRNFASLAASLGHQLDKPRRIIGLDLRNHGDSDHAQDMTYEAMARDVLHFLDHQNLEHVILVGHSMGGKVAQALSLLHPHRVHGLVVLDIAPVAYTSTDPHWKAVEDIMHAMKDAQGAGSKSELDKHLRTSIPDPNLRAFVLTNYDTRSNQWKIPVATICEQLDAIAGFDLPSANEDKNDASVQRSYDGDVFIIHGGQSRFVRHAYMDQIAEFFPNHMLTTIRGAGHWVHAEAPDDTIALLKRYLDR